MNRRSFVHASALGTLAAFVGVVHPKADAEPVSGLAPIFASRAWLDGRFAPARASGAS